MFLHSKGGSIGMGLYAGHKALHTCMSWYAYAAMWRQFTTKAGATKLL